MNAIQQDESVTHDLLHAWHKKKNIKCPTCKTCVFHFDGTPDFSFVRVKYEIELIHHSPCPSSVGKCGKGLFFCLSCGAQSSPTFGRIQDRGCKCVGVDKNKVKKSHNRQILTKDSAASSCEDVEYLGESSMANDGNRKNPTGDIVSYSQNNPAEDLISSNDDLKYDVNNSYESASDLCEDLAVNAAMGNKNKTDGSGAKNPTEDCVSLSQNNPSEDHVANTNDDVGYDVLNSSELASELSENFVVNPTMGPVYTSPRTILANRNEWSSVSARFFIRVHKNQGDGLRGLVFNSVVESKNSSEFSSLTVHEMFLHLHIASIHYGISTAKSIDITNMMLHNSSEHNQIAESERNVLSDAYHNSIVQVLTGSRILNNPDQIQTILQEINNQVHTELQSNHFKSRSVKLSAPEKHKTVRAVYIEGQNSIVKNLPIPTVGVTRLLTSQQEKLSIICWLLG
jgi:hypothetical protein